MPSGRRHYRLKLADALEAHETALQRGGAVGIIDIGYVEAAIARPYTGYYRSIFQKCAALTESVCRNHGFTDGNKRTCLLLLAVLLDRSGYQLVPVNDEDIDVAIETLMVRTSEGRLSFDEIKAWFTARVCAF